MASVFDRLTEIGGAIIAGEDGGDLGHQSHCAAVLSRPMAASFSQRRHKAQANKFYRRTYATVGSASFVLDHREVAPVITNDLKPIAKRLVHSNLKLLGNKSLAREFRCPRLQRCAAQRTVARRVAAVNGEAFKA
jgi:hypothetical protein